MVVQERFVEFLGETPNAKGKRLRMEIPVSAIRDVVERKGFLILRTYRLGFAPIDPDSFTTEADRKSFMDKFGRARN